MTEKEAMLKALLDNILDSYDGFSECGLAFCRSVPNGVDKIIEIIQNNPKITSSEIADIVADMRGCDKQIL